MTLEFFYKNYDLLNTNVKSAEIKNDKLILLLDVSAHLELIANGYRPELDVEHEIEFIFSINKENKVYNNPIIKEAKYDKNLMIKINDDVLLLEDQVIEVNKRN